MNALALVLLALFVLASRAPTCGTCYEDGSPCGAEGVGEAIVAQHLEAGAEVR